MNKTLLACTLLLASAATPALASPEDEARAVLAEQQAAWNKGDLEGFMAGYWRDKQLRFASGATARYGWQATLDGYRKAYPNRAAMGLLNFELREVRALSDKAVFVFGSWALTLKPAGRKKPHGLFTLLLEQKEGRWVVVHDHTSAAKE